MLSRVADALYWMSRYVERAENVARFISVNLNLLLDAPGTTEEQWMPLVVTTGDRDPFQERYREANRQNVLHFLTFDEENPNSIISCLTSARSNARSVREIISAEMWEHINRTYLMVKEGLHNPELEQLADFHDQIRRSGQHFIGVTDATMTHNEGWHFCRLARLIERADKTSRILDVKYFMLLPSPVDVGTTLDDAQWSALLRSASGFQMYRQRHGRITPSNVVEFLVLDRQFPRAILYCLTKANESLHAVTGAALGGFTNQAEKKLGQLQAELAFVRAHEIIDRGLHEFIDNLQTRMNDVGEAIYETFLAIQPIGQVQFQSMRRLNRFQNMGAGYDALSGSESQ
jgi:uncharacterized alpha-E superfamily protein